MSFPCYSESCELLFLRSDNDSEFAMATVYLLLKVSFDKYLYYPTALRRVQITRKTSRNITRYLYSRGPVRQVSCH